MTEEQPAGADEVVAGATAAEGDTVAGADTARAVPAAGESDQTPRPSELAQAVSEPDLAEMLRAIPVRVGAELGRARMPLAQAVDLGPGIVIELDRDADDPVELTINGRPFASGQLLLDGGQWAIRIDGLCATSVPPRPPGGGLRGLLG
jgi:flagellar motor switch protein FliN/FliY